MGSLFEVKAVDRRRYEALREFLPSVVIDAHAHVWPAGAGRSPAAEGRAAAWPSRVAECNPVEHLLESYRLLLPHQSVVPVVFGSPTAGGELDDANRYVCESAGRHGLPALALTSPAWGAEDFERRLADGGFVGAKPYLTFAPAGLPADEITVFDFLPPHQLEVLDRRGWIVMLHLPRPGRLRDEVNLRQLLEIEGRFPRLRLVVAHVGRAYCPRDVGSAFEALAGTRRMCFDISANTNQQVFRRLLAAVGPGRVLFGTDLPITRMRMRRICRGGRYVNLVPRGLYGDVSGDPHMREVDAPQAENLTFFLYEQLESFRRAARAEGLSHQDVENVFYNNARRLLDETGGRG